MIASIITQTRSHSDGQKQAVNKTQAVRDYLKAHPKAMSGEIAAALNKKGVKITSGHVANIKTKINKDRTAKKGGEATGGSRGSGRQPWRSQ